MITRLHATAVALDVVGVPAAVLLEGPSARGKSDLALRLIDGGARLVADDITELSVEGGRLIASAPEGFSGLLEVRGVGIVRMPAAPSAPVAAIVSLLPRGEHSERHPEPEFRELLEIAVPLWRLNAEGASAAARVRTMVSLATGALQRHVD